MRIALLITGPNASGKTTLVDRAMTPWREDPRVTAIHGDGGAYSKGATAASAQLMAATWAGPAEVLVIEGIDRIARATIAAARADGTRQLQMFVTQQAPGIMRAHLAARCALRGKTFNAPYWTLERLNYEGQRRYRALAERSGFPYTTWTTDEDYSGHTALIARLQLRIMEALG